MPTHAAGSADSGVVVRRGAYTYFDATLPERLAAKRIATTDRPTIRMRNVPTATAGARSNWAVAGRDSTRYFGGADLR